MNSGDVNQIAYRVISENDVDLAMDFLKSPETRPQHSVWLLYKLSQCCHADQAAWVGYLVDEFAPEGTTPGIGKFLRRYEFRMYRRLKLRRGMEKSLRRYVSLSPEGRALLRSLGNGGLLEP
jgi:hypothetical protein